MIASVIVMHACLSSFTVGQIYQQQVKTDCLDGKARGYRFAICKITPFNLFTVQAKYLGVWMLFYGPLLPSVYDQGRVTLFPQLSSTPTTPSATSQTTMPLRVLALVALSFTDISGHAATRNS
jgi:hypothetical protein